MYLPLATIDVWVFDGEINHLLFSTAIQMLCIRTDTMVIGSYNPSEEARCWLLANDFAEHRSDKPFSDTFHLNKSKYPLGRTYTLHASPERLRDFETLSADPNGSVDKSLFYDHFALYRSGEPLIPLLNFHDAFCGGQLYLSGHYSKEHIEKFEALLQSKASLILNPDLEPR